MLLQTACLILLTKFVQGDNNLFIAQSRNFEEVVKSDFFVDKSLLIKELLSDPRLHFIEILAAPHFGKSTNNDMIKTFLEIKVDKKGLPKSVQLTKNYKIFTSRKLEICKNTEILQHFGKYPVISIEYKPFILVSNFEKLLNKYRDVLLKTFRAHKYLLESDSLWLEQFNRTTFEKYVYRRENSKLNSSEIQNGFLFLADVLYKHFNKRVVVLIDDYDIIKDCPVSEKYRDRVYNFIIQINNDLVEYKDRVERAVLTGSLLRGGLPHSLELLSHHAVAPHLWRYYGINTEELVGLVKKVITNDEEADEAASFIVDNYSGYIRPYEVYDEFGTNPRNISVCSVWSVIQYFKCIKKIGIELSDEEY